MKCNSTFFVLSLFWMSSMLEDEECVMFFILGEILIYIDFVFLI